MKSDSKNSVGIFWFYSDHVICKFASVEDLKPDSLGLIDSPYLHVTEWESKHIYLPQFPELIGTEYQEFPRGRVILDLNTQSFKVILDKSIFNKRNIELVKSAFGLEQSKVAYFADQHYQVFKAV